MTHTCTCGCIPGHLTAAECTRNRETTRAMMQRRTEAAIDQFTEAQESRELIATATILGTGRVQIGDDLDWDVVIGSQHDRKIIALRSTKYRETSYGSVLFVRDDNPRYADLAAVAIDVSRDE